MNFIVKLTSFNFIAVALSLIVVFVQPKHAIAQANVAPSFTSTNNVTTIVLDAGHGGKDPGAINNKTREKDITLAVTKMVGEILNKVLPDVKVIYTRTKDKFLALHERSEIANKNNADLFISIHCNYFKKNRAAYGSETYVMGLHKIKSNLSVSKRENAAVELESNTGQYYKFDVNSPEGHIFLATYQNAYLEQSIKLADFIEQHLKTDKKLLSRGVKQAGFHVLSNTTMPSVLIETGFMTNSEEGKLLNSRNGQKTIANAIVNAIIDYKNSVENSNIAKSKLEQKKEDPLIVSKKEETSISYKAKTIYSVQIAASSKHKKNLYKSIPDCRIKKEGKMYKYLVGECKSFGIAEKRRKQLLVKGFKDAFIVAYKQDKRVTLPR